MNDLCEFHKTTFSSTNRILFYAGTPGDQEFIRLMELLDRLILDLDAVDTQGVEALRNRRRQAVREIQCLIEMLDFRAQTSSARNLDTNALGPCSDCGGCNNGDNGKGSNTIHQDASTQQSSQSMLIPVSERSNTSLVSQ
ncbi:unnamed protein product [Protopolystoma xenopodis]|uniref:BAG domain-containing protein n=1 Tax=Protopolystoma xenopodis TaxID=117903 RepID=A0A448XIU3_9PLAT|nr:unnamed protein product [Protopolystoma xenopodis]